MNDEGSFAVGFIVGCLISGPLVWIIAFIAEKSETRRGAFWCIVLQVVLAIIAIVVVSLI